MRVYSGKTVQRNPLILIECCIQKLKKNIELVKFFGNAPYELIRPILESSTPKQLMNIENLNPALLNDTNVIWESHIKKKFNLKRRLQMESGRQMYERCQMED